jgi:TonB family protein
VKLRCGQSVLRFVARVAVLVPFGLAAQQNASFHAVEYRSAAAGRVRILGPAVHALYAPSPAYTKQAQEAKAKGTVVLEGTLGTDGCLRDLRILRRVGYGLDESAIRTVQYWKFSPFLKSGVPAETRVVGEMEFDAVLSPDDRLAHERKCGQ